jgi:hypothetical protein
MPLGWRLQAAGCQTATFSYAAFFETFDQIVERLREQLHHLGQQGPYSVVAHSLGGLLLRAALSQNTVLPPAHTVMLGTPNQRPRLAPIAWQLLPFQWVTGQCGFNLAQRDFFQKLPSLRSPYTIIAGVAGPRGWFSPFGTEANDGIVAIGETCMTERDRPLEFPVEHTFMMNDPAVQSAVISVIQNSVQLQPRASNENKSAAASHTTI